LAVVDVFSGIKQQDKVRSSGGGPTVYAYLMGVGDGANDTYDGCLQRGGTESECAFLENNMLEEGIIRLPSGVQYKVVRNGSGASPGPDDTVQVDFRGTLLDGTEFDSSRRRGGISRFRVDEAIPGLQDVLQSMEEGGKWQVYVPTELAFRQPSPFSGQTVVFEIELVAIEGRQARVPASPPAATVPTASSQSVAQARAEAPAESAETVPEGDRQPANDGMPLWEQVEARTRRFLEENARRPDVVTLPSGLQYKVIGRGGGSGQVPRETDTVVLHYRGTFPDGREFESSRKDGGPVTFSMQEVAPGWKEALLQMQVGDSWELYLPPALAQDSETRLLGTRGQQALIYEIELVAVQ
jgi:FKBP-type peptidyl-prolyl cis-trans isomerase